MKKLLLIPIAALAVAVGAGVAFAQDGPPPPPTSGVSVADDLPATGAGIGSDGALYIATGGTGGDQVLDSPPDEPDLEVTFGLTATIVRIAENGTRTTVAENLPSAAADGEPFGAIADIEFNGSTMYFLLTGSLDKMGAEDWPNGVYEVTADGTDTELFADIGAFNDANPVDFEDAGPGGNPFAIERRGSGFVVSDGNFNRLLSINGSGVISVLSAFDNVVPTGLATGPSSSVLNTWFSPAPHLPGESHVVSVASIGGAVTELASGPVSMIDVTTAADGSVYVLQFSDFVADETAPPTPTGRIYQLEGGELTLLVDGFVLPTSLQISGDTAYVTTLTGAVWQIENFSSIAPLPDPVAPTAVPSAPAATPTRGTGVTAPDTGDGSAADGGGSAWLIVLAIAAAGVALAASGARLARDRR